MAQSQIVRIGDRDFTLSLLRLGAVRKHLPELAAVQGMKAGEQPTADQFDAMITLVHASASVAEPGLTRDQFAAIVDAADYDTGMRELVQAFRVAMQRSGFSDTNTSTVAGQVRHTGEPSALETSSAPSETSTDASSPSPAGPLSALTT